MGIFKKTKSSTTKQNSNSVRSQIRHHAVWGTNGVTFFVERAGVSWSYDSPMGYMDDVFAQAALCQLERAYRLNVSFPHSEKMVMSMGRLQHPDVKEPITPFFDWQPPLP